MIQNQTTGTAQFYQIKSNNLGWTCPNCGKVFSPTVTECYYCNSTPETTFSGTTVTMHDEKQEV